VIGNHPAPHRCIRILVVDAHAGVRGAIATLVEASDDMELVGQAANMGEAMRLCASQHPHIALVGVAFRGPNGLDAIATIQRCWPKIRIVAMGGLQEAQHRQAVFEAGAAGYVLKYVSADELAAAIRVACASALDDGSAARPNAAGRKQTQAC